MNRNATSLLCLLILLYTPLSAQWVKTNGPQGMSVTSFFEKDSILLCGTNAQGVYRSADHGHTWFFSGINLENIWVQCFSSDANYIYAGCFGNGVYRSSDFGHTWLPANIGIQNEAIYSLLKVGGTLFAGTVSNGIFKSTNNGITWVDANGGALGSSFIKAMVYQDGRLMVEADNYIFFSYDFGNTWDVDQGITQFYQIYYFFQHGDTILAAAFNNLFRTTDGGLNWTGPYQLSTTVTGFDQVGNTIYAGTGFGVYYSNNWGLTWTQVPATTLRTGASAFIISGNSFLLGREELGITISTDTGQSWSEIPLSQFEPASSIDDAMIFANNKVYSGTHGDGVYSTSDQGNTWTKIGTTNPFDTLSNENIFSMFFIQPNILLAGGCGTGLFRSADNGVTWTHITAGLPVEDVFGDSFTCIHTFAKCGSNILAACWLGVYYSSDLGLTWHPTNLLAPIENGYLDAGGFAIRGNIACVGISAYPMQSGIYRSTNNGVTWTLAEPVLDVAFMATGGGSTMYAGDIFLGSYVSHDDGLTWAGMGVGPAFTLLAWNQYAFIGNNLGVFFSNNFGSTWTQMNQGMDPYPNNAVQGFTTDSVYLYAGMYRDAIWRRPLSDFGIGTPCNTIVSNTNDTGTGSLRNAIGCAQTGGTITFIGSLTDQTITLTSGEINIGKNLTLEGLGMTHLTISGNTASRIFHLDPGRNLQINNMALQDTKAPENGGAIFTEGALTLKNILLRNNLSNGEHRAWTASTGASVTIQGTVEVRN